MKQICWNPGNSSSLIYPCGRFYFWTSIKFPFLRCLKCLSTLSISEYKYVTFSNPTENPGSRPCYEHHILSNTPIPQMEYECILWAFNWPKSTLSAIIAKFQWHGCVWYVRKYNFCSVRFSVSEKLGAKVLCIVHYIFSQIFNKFLGLGKCFLLF
jgi:hypothetical protein